MNLRATIDQLAQTFAEGVLAAIRDASLEDLLTSKGAARDASATHGKQRPAKSPRKKPATSPRDESQPSRAESDAPATSVAKKTADPKEHAGAVLAALTASSGGLRAEELRKTLGLTNDQITPVLAWALDEGRITKHGRNRGMTYTAK